jgi:hypothetical protein
VFSAAVNKATGNTTPVVPVPAVAPIGGQQAPEALTPAAVAKAKAHPLFGAVAGLLAKKFGTTSDHPAIELLATAAVNDGPTLLKLLADAAPLVLAAGS